MRESVSETLKTLWKVGIWDQRNPHLPYVLCHVYRFGSRFVGKLRALNPNAWKDHINQTSEGPDVMVWNMFLPGLTVI